VQLKRLTNKNIVLGITGSIAAYKACDIIRMLKKEGADVKVVTTDNALKFITPLALETLSGNEVVKEMFPEHRVVKTRHISIAEWADAILIAPATANVIGKIASGIADDFLTTLVMASRAPVVIAPAMDYEMVTNPIYLENCKKLEKHNFTFVPTEEGPLASGAVGPGRLAKYDIILNRVLFSLQKKSVLKGKKVLVSAGPTIEPIDPVRFISNYSTGKMGFAVAEAAVIRGADVILVTGQVSIDVPFGVKCIKVGTAADMEKAILDEISEADVLIMAAAVADYRVEKYSGNKIKKSGDLTLKLKKNKDIINSVLEKKRPKVLVGFAMETNDSEKNAVNKLKDKKLDFICMNNLYDEGAGFAKDTNKVTIFEKNGSAEELPVMSKFGLAEKILDKVEKYFREN